MKDKQKNEFLKGLRVVELASVLAGPAVGMFFSELGAEVIKIENKRMGGDVTRTWRLPNESISPDTISSYYASVNWNKETYLLDLEDSEEQAIALKYIQTADIVISNFKTSAAKRLGMDYESLRIIRPDLIFGYIQGFPDDDERVAFDVVLQAEAGFMYMNGSPESEPTKMPVALIDVLAAHQLKEGILLALLKRFQTGKGSLVKVSLLEAALASLVNQATNWLMVGHIAQRIGSLHPNIAPYGELFSTADGKRVVLAIGSDRQFAALCEVLNATELLKNPLFSKNTLRVAHRTELADLLAKKIAEQPSEAFLDRCHKAQVPVGCVRNMKEVFELPAAQNQILTEKNHQNQTSKRMATIAFTIE